MLRQSGIGVAFLLAGLAGPVQGQVKLEWKFKEGDKFYVQSVLTSKQSIDLLKTEAETTTTIVTSYAVKKVTNEGAVLEQKVESVKLKSRDVLSSKLGEVMKLLEGGTFSVTVSPAGQVAKFEGYAEFAKKLPASAQPFLPEDIVREASEEFLGVLPDRAVKQGDKWKRKQTMTAPMLGTFTLDREFAYQGKGKEGEEISFEATMSYMPPKAGAAGQLFKVTKGEFKADEMKGTIVFNPETGRVVRQETKMRAKGSLTIDVNGVEAPMNIVLEQTTKTQVSDKPPKE